MCNESSDAGSDAAGQPEHLYPIEVGEKFGFIDAGGNVKIEPQFDLVGDFHGGLAAVYELDFDGPTDPLTNKVPRKVGYINTAGELVVPVQFRLARDYSEGLAAVHTGEKWGFIDRNGRMVIAPEYDAAWFFTEGVAPAMRGKEYVALAPSGEILFEVAASALGHCRDGLMPCEIRRRWSFLNKTGDTAFELTCTAGGEFSQGRAAILAKGAMGYIDTDGNWVIAPQFSQAMPFREGVAPVELFNAGPKCNDYSRPQTFGYIDRDGNLAMKATFRCADLFSEGLAAVQPTLERAFAYIDPDGQTVIPLIRCTFAGRFVGGIARIQEEGSTAYYIDRRGELVWA